LTASTSAASNSASVLILCWPSCVRAPTMRWPCSSTRSTCARPPW
jgi:hypothetical protein